MSQYPIRVLSFGAGVQSTTLLRMMIEGEIEPAKHVIFSDTGWEPQAVYEHMGNMRRLAEKAGMEFHVVSKGNIRKDIFDAEAHFGSMPVFVINKEGNRAISRRQCTEEYKIKPLMRKQREIAGLKRGARSNEHRITTIIGISLDEFQRMRDPAFSWIQHEYPLIDMRMTRQDCLRYHEKRKLERPPRSACIGCPYHSDAEWRYLRDNDPDAWADAIYVDEQIRTHPVASERMYQGRAYLHSKRIPLKEVDLSTEEDRGQLSLFGQECQGMCGL